MVKIKKEFIFLTAIIICGFILRVVGINFGLPYLAHQDEPIVVNHALAYGTGDLNPHFFAIPPLASYILFFIYCIYFIIGKLFGIFHGANDFASSFLKDPTMFYILGRLFVGVIPGTLCIFATYKLCKEFFYNKLSALFACAIIAFSYVNISDSHYIYTDMLLSLFVIISMIRINRILCNPSLRNYIICAVFIGIAVSAKYNAVFLLCPFIISHVLCLAKKRTNNFRLVIALFMLIVACFLFNPFAFLDFKFFLSAIIIQSKSAWYIGWLHHMKYSLHESIGIIFLITGLIGFLVLLIKERFKAFIFLSFPAAFYLHLVFKSQPYARYALSLVPFFAISVGYFVFEYLVPLINNRLARIFIISLFTLPFILLVTKAVKIDSICIKKDTRIEAAQWIKNNISSDKRFAFDHTFFRPALLQNKEQILAKCELINKQKSFGAIKHKKIELMLEAIGAEGFCIYFLNNTFKSEGEFILSTPVMPFDFDVLREKGIDYIVVNYQNHMGDTDHFYAEINKQAKLIYSISPYSDSQSHFNADPVATTGLPVISKELFRRTKCGPSLEIYKLKR